MYIYKYIIYSELVTHFIGVWIITQITFTESVRCFVVNCQQFSHTDNMCRCPFEIRNNVTFSNLQVFWRTVYTCRSSSRRRWELDLTAHLSVCLCLSLCLFIWNFIHSVFDSHEKMWVHVMISVRLSVRPAVWLQHKPLCWDFLGRCGSHQCQILRDGSTYCALSVQILLLLPQCTYLSTLF